MSNKKFTKVKPLFPQGAPQKVPVKKTPNWVLAVRKLYNVFELVVYWAFGIDCIVLLYVILFVWL